MTRENIEILGNEENKNENDFYTKFKERLVNNLTFPTTYLYKFIASANPEKIDQILAVFGDKKISISAKPSKTGKYKSLTIHVPVDSSDEIIDYYKAVSAIKDVVML